MNDENKNLNTPSDDDDGLNGLFDLFERLRSEHGGALPFGPGGDDDDDDDDGEYSNMDASDFHNLSCRYAPHNKTKAISVCRAGLERYPNDMDLLADIVKYATENGDLATAEIYYGKLMTEVPMKRFNWRAFTFAFDYLIHHVNQREDECRALVEAYKSHLPHEEKAAMSESELESALGNHEQSMAVLKDAISRLPNAPQCALRLADRQMELGQVDEVIRTVDYGLAASAEMQPSINIPYLYYLRTLSEDHILHRSAAKGESVSKEEIERVKTLYQSILDSFDELKRHRSNISTRIKLLDLLALRV